MQHTLHLQTQFLFGTEHDWVLFERSRYSLLQLPSHLEDQLLRVLYLSMPYGILVECQVAEQCPKDAYCHLARGLRYFTPKMLILNVVHSRTHNAHAVFWRDAQPARYHHLDIDFTHLSELDKHLLELLKQPNSSSKTQLFQLIEGRDEAKHFFKALKRHIAKVDHPSPASHQALVDLLLKLIFLVFVERKGWLNFDNHYLENRMDFCNARQLSIVHTFLTPLFMRLEGGRCHEFMPLGELPHLGGGLFQFSPDRLPRIENQWCMDLISSLLARFSFSLFEGHAGRNVVGIGPEIMGHVFEKLLHSGDRRATGTYYTPCSLAEKQVEATLDAYLDAHRKEPDAQQIQLLTQIRILDPACGSGAYLMAAYRALLKRRLIYAPQEARYNGQLFALKQQIMLENLYGLDINPLAVRLTEVRLWLNMIQDLEIARPLDAPALPSLQHHIRTGDFVNQYIPAHGKALERWPKLRRLEQLREAFPRREGNKRQTILRHITRLEAELLAFLQEQDAQAERARLKMQAAQTHLPDVLPNLKWQKPADNGLCMSPHIFFSRAMLEGGFQLIVGNPPWLSASKLKCDHRVQLKTARLPPGLVLRGQTDLSCYFLAASLQLLRQGGSIGFLLPGKFLQARFGAPFRNFLAQQMRLDYLFDYGVDHGLVFKADTFPLALGITKYAAEPQHPVLLERHSREGCTTATRPQSDFMNALGAWPTREPRAADLERLQTETLGRLGFKVHRGVVTGNKRLFVCKQPPTGWNPKHWRALMRGRDIQADHLQAGSWLYWPFDSSCEIPEFSDLERKSLEMKGFWIKGKLLPKLPYRVPLLKGWLLVWKYLAQRWEVHLLPAAQWVPDQTCYYIALDHFPKAYRLFLYFNSDQARDWLERNAERGKDRCLFFYAHTIETLPVPWDWSSAPILEPDCEGAFTPFQAEGKWRTWTAAKQVHSIVAVYQPLVIEQAAGGA